MRQAILASGFQVKELAERCNISRSRLSSWFNNINGFSPASNQEHRAILQSMADVGGFEPETVDAIIAASIVDSQPMIAEQRTAYGVSVDLLDLYLDALESHATPQSQKKAARDAIKSMFSELMA